MANVTLFFEAINKDEHRFVVLAKGAQPRADNCEAACRTAEEKQAFGCSSTSAEHRPRKRDLIEPQTRCRLRSQADSMSIHDKAEDARCNARRSNMPCMF